MIDRIKSLAIPPAWEDVWICSDPNGHIQATGLDAKGRRQYRYHDEWRAARDREKHDRILRFARRLPALREQVAHDIALDGMPRERVLACAVRLLELGFFRIGGEAYAEENDTYGLATIRKRHVRVRGELLEFDYDAKSGQHRLCQVADDEVRAVITTLRRRRAPADAELLAYKDGREWVDVKSSDINEYVQEHIGDEFSAKDFRTWVGTVLAAVGLATEDGGESETSRKRAVASVVKDVAEHLGNTPAVARSAYIDPRVVERFEKDDTVEDALADVDIEDLDGGIPEEVEQAVLDLIDRARRSKQARAAHRVVAELRRRGEPRTRSGPARRRRRGAGRGRARRRCCAAPRRCRRRR